MMLVARRCLTVMPRHPIRVKVHAPLRLEQLQRQIRVIAVKKELRLSRRIARLQRMQQLFKYWHVVHMPFALIMLVVVIIHIGITVAMGYRWIF